MSFEYNEVDFGELESVRLVEGDVSPKTKDTDGKSGDLSKEQKRKSQLVDLLSEDFDNFHALLDKLIGCYYSYGRRRELVSETLGVPDYVNCENCGAKAESPNGNPICKEAEIKEDGETLYKIIPDTESVPSFCSRDMRWMNFPEHLVESVDDELQSIAESGFEEYAEEQREKYRERREEAKRDGREHSDYVTKDLSDLVTTREEYTSRELDKLVRGLFDPRDFDDFRKSALRVAWLLHLDDVLQEDYHPQRAEAYLRVMDSCHQSDTLPGQGGDVFEKEVRDYLRSLGFPMFERAFKIEGCETSHKEMDIYTELPWGERAIFEVFTTGAHSEKHKQLKQYGRLLELAESVDPVQVLMCDGHLSKQRLDEDLLYDFLSTQIDSIGDIEPPGNHNNPFPSDEVELLGHAESLSYNQYESDFEPVDGSKKRESRLMAKLRGMGYNPSLPVFKQRRNYGYCGPTITVGDGGGSISLTLYSNRESAWEDVDDAKEANKRNERMFERLDGSRRFKWQMVGPSGWGRYLSEVIGKPVIVAEIGDFDQSLICSGLFDRLLRENPL